MVIIVIYNNLANSQNKGSTMNTETETLNTYRLNHILKNRSNKNLDKNIISDRKNTKKLNIVNIKNNVEKVIINNLGNNRW